MLGDSEKISFLVVNRRDGVNGGCTLVSHFCGSRKPFYFFFKAFLGLIWIHAPDVGHHYVNGDCTFISRSSRHE